MRQQYTIVRIDVLFLCWDFLGTLVCNLRINLSLSKVIKGTMYKTSVSRKDLLTIPSFF